MVADARREIRPAPAKPKPAEWSDNKITVAWLGRASVLINLFGIRVLTDPAFFSRIGIRTGFGVAGPKRYVACPLKPKDLPPIDLVLLFHAHLDHMDLSSLAKVYAPINYTMSLARRLQFRVIGPNPNYFVRVNDFVGTVPLKSLTINHFHPDTL